MIEIGLDRDSDGDLVLTLTAENGTSLSAGYDQDQMKRALRRVIHGLAKGLSMIEQGEPIHDWHFPESGKEP